MLVMRHKHASWDVESRPEQCGKCAGQEFETIGVGMWDGERSGVFYRVRCLNCHSVWETYPSHEALNAGEPLKWRPEVTHNQTLQRTGRAVKRSWLQRLF